MKLWVYAGGGYAEVNGLIPFLQQHFSHFQVTRRTPAFRRPGPRPARIEASDKPAHPPARTYAGNTGKDLLQEVKNDLVHYWDKSVPMILLLDDTDCKIETESIVADLRNVVVQTLLEEHSYTEEALPQIVVGLAVPELESWILADWDHTFKPMFGNCHAALRHSLSTKHQISLNAPESFNCRDSTGNYKKISKCICEAVEECCQTRFSKDTDTSRLLLSATPQEIANKCPHFRRFWAELQK